jgi:uncharacterized membrane protein YecN with MAPEG domain
MTVPVVTMLYAGLAALMLLVLSFRVIAVRRDARVGLGDGGIERLQQRIRAHANFAEYVPLALILMALIETSRVPSWPLHLIGIALLAGRAVHAWSLSAENLMGRTVGMSLTFAVLVVSAVWALTIWAAAALAPVT